MSVYTPLSPAWANGPGGNTPVNAERLGHMEGGIEAVDDAVDALTTTVGGHTTTIGTHTTQITALGNADTALDGRLDVLEASQEVSPDALAHGVTGATETIDVSAARVHTITLDADCTLTINAWPTSGIMGEVIIVATQDGTGGWEITWPAAVLWPGGTEPTLTATAAGVDLIRLWTINAGATIYGQVLGLDMS